jgi:hypothetical protein
MFGPTTGRILSVNHICTNRPTTDDRFVRTGAEFILVRVPGHKRYELDGQTGTGIAHLCQNLERPCLLRDY